MDEWQRVKVSDICRKIVDCVNRTAPVVEYPTQFRMIRTTNVRHGRINLTNCKYVDEPTFRRWTRRAPVEDGDVILTREAPIGEVGYIQNLGSVFLGQRIMQFKPDPKIIDPRFLFFAFRSPELQHQFGMHEGSGSVVSHIRVADCFEFAVPLPPLTEQQAIARLLGALDDKIELSRRMNETMEAMARAVFKDWFVDFGPARAKMEGRAPYLAPDIWCLFPDRINADGLPEGWTTEALLDHANLISGGTPKTKEPAYWNGPIQWASAKDVSQCGDAFLITTERSITQRGLDESATRIIPKFATVVVARGATTGRHCLFGRNIAMNQTCYALSSSRKRPFWLNCAFESLVQELVHAAHGSVFDTITTTTLRGADSVIADSALLDQFERTVEPLFLQALANVEQSRTLAETRDLLLPKLMSGEIRIRGAEKIVEAAA